MLAIVIPYYKIDFFEDTLKSLASQSDQRFRVYIGNDGSLANPEAIISKYESRFKLHYKKFENNLGKISLTQHWDRCLQMVENESWITVLCDDDLLGNNYIENFYKSLDSIKQKNCKVIRFATQLIDFHGKITSGVFEHPEIETSKDFLMRKLKGGTRSSLSEFIFESTTLKKVRFVDLPLAWYSDYLAVLEVSDFENIYTINQSIVYIRMSGINISSRNDDLVEKNCATFNFYYYLLNKFKTKFNSDEQNILYFKLEKTFLDNKKNLLFWLKLSILYFTNFQFKRYILFIKKVILAILAKFNKK